MPGFKRPELMPGPLSDLVDALHQLHLAAGCPSARELQRELGSGVASHTSVYKLFTGTAVPRWGLVELIVEAMARRARLDGKAEVERFQRLWAQAAGSGGAASASEVPAAARAHASRPSNEEEAGRFSRPIGDLLPELLDEIEAVGARSATGNFRIPTGFDDLDAVLGGWTQGCLAVVGGWPASGKTTLLLDFCRAASLKYRLPSLFVSGEMNSRELQSRLLSAEARVSLHCIRTGQMEEKDWARLARVMTLLSDAPIRISTPSDFQIEQLSADVAALAKGSGLKLLLIDGLECVTHHDLPALVSEEFALWRLKRLAETLKIPIIVAAQAERTRKGVYMAPNSIRQLKASDAIERVADVIIMLHRPDQDDPLDRVGEADLTVAKSRNGPTATVTVAYQPHYCRFVSFQSDEDPLFPAESDKLRHVGSSGAAQQASAHDIKLYRRFVDQLAPNGPVIEWLKLDFMAKTLPSGLFGKLEELTKIRDLDPVGFDNHESDDSYQCLISAIQDFCSVVSWWTWIDKEQHWLSVPLDWREDDPERWAEATTAILEKRDSLIKAYDEFLLTCHRNNVDHDSPRL